MKKQLIVHLSMVVDEDDIDEMIYHIRYLSHLDIDNATVRYEVDEVREVANE